MHTKVLISKTVWHDSSPKTLSGNTSSHTHLHCCLRYQLDDYSYLSTTSTGLCWMGTIAKQNYYCWLYVSECVCVCTRMAPANMYVYIWCTYPRIELVSVWRWHLVLPRQSIRPLTWALNWVNFRSFTGASLTWMLREAGINFNPAVTSCSLRATWKIEMNFEWVVHLIRLGTGHT